MNMQVEQIKSEIEKRLKSKDFGFDDEAEYGYGECLRDLKGFINSLEEEPASDDLEKAAEEYVEKIRDLGNSTAHPQFNCHDAERLFIHGGKWQKQQIMKDAKEATVIMTHITNESLSPALSVVILPDTFHEGDKVEVIIVKKG